jgi:hypothetical protein
MTAATREGREQESRAKMNAAVAEVWDGLEAELTRRGISFALNTHAHGDRKPINRVLGHFVSVDVTPIRGDSTFLTRWDWSGRIQVSIGDYSGKRHWRTRKAGWDFAEMVAEMERVAQRSIAAQARDARIRAAREATASDARLPALREAAKAAKLSRGEHAVQVHDSGRIELALGTLTLEEAEAVLAALRTARGGA